MSNIVKIQNVEHLTAMIKAIVPRSFEKTFSGLSTNEVVAGFAFCATGLSQTELNTGLAKIQEMGFCPDPAMFAKWCKGLDGFNNTDTIADSYIGKSGALANVKRWLSDSTLTISQAEKQAYDQVYELFEQAGYASNAEFAQAEADRAFKDHYQHIVRELVANRQVCQRYTPPVALPQSKPQETKTKCEPASKEFVQALFKKHGLKGLSGINKIGAVA